MTVCQQTEALYHSHHDWLVRWLYHRLNCIDTAADLAHDTFVRLLGKSELAPIREPRAYLGTIAHGLAVNYLRRCDVERAYLQALAAQETPLMPSLEERELVIEAINLILRAFDGLPKRAQEIFTLSQIEGLSYRQIAEQLDITVNIVQKDMIKAMTCCYAAIYE